MSDNLETLMFLMGKKLETSSNNSENTRKKRNYFDWKKKLWLQ